jgi:3-hexulose-6-phosphate synthase
LRFDLWEEDPLLLQLAIDDPRHLGIASALSDLVDIIEVGTPLLKRFGLSAVGTARQLGGDCVVLVDSKTTDGGARESEMLFAAGADLITVLAAASPETHQAVSQVATQHDRHVLVDTICSPVLPDRPDAFPDRFTFLGLHMPTDRRLAGQATHDHITSIPDMRRLGYRVAIAGGIGPDTIDMVVAARPDIVIVGSAITQSPDPRRACECIRSHLTDPGRGWPPATN